MYVMVSKDAPAFPVTDDNPNVDFGGREFHIVEGMYGGVREQAFLVHCPTTHDVGFVMHKASMWGQESILVVDKLSEVAMGRMVYVNGDKEGFCHPVVNAVISDYPIPGGYTKVGSKYFCANVLWDVILPYPWCVPSSILPPLATPRGG